MKKLIGIIIMAMVIGVAVNAYAATNISQSASASVAAVLSVEFSTYGTFNNGSIPWTTVDPSSDYIRPTGSATTRSDVALVCRYNGSAANWYLKMRLTTSNLTGKIYRQIPQPNLRDPAGTPTTGTVAGNTTDYWVVPATDTTVYTSGSNDRINTPNGTFVGVNYALRPEGLQNGGAGYSGTLYYTITTTA